MFKKVIVVLMFVAMCMPTVTRAESTTNVDSLLAQIKELQAKLADLNKQKTEVETKLQSVTVLARELSVGASGEDVKALQEILAADPTIYPQKLVTGYFGQLTKEAVERYQEKYKLKKDGRISLETRMRLNDDVSKEEFRCKAWGNLIAPGLEEKRLNNVKIDLSRCSKVPQGISNQLSTSNTISDISGNGLTMSAFKVEVSNDEVKIKFRTNRATKAGLWYNVASPQNSSSAKEDQHLSFKTEHEFELKNLASNTGYIFTVEVKDRVGNKLSSAKQTFVTGSDDNSSDDDSDDGDDDDSNDDHGNDGDEDDDD